MILCRLVNNVWFVGQSRTWELVHYGGYSVRVIGWMIHLHVKVKRYCFFFLNLLCKKMRSLYLFSKKNVCSELTQSLQSLNDIINLINTTTTFDHNNYYYNNNNNNNNNNNFMMNPMHMAYLNQPIVATANNMFLWWRIWRKKIKISCSCVVLLGVWSWWNHSWMRVRSIFVVGTYYY